MIADYWVALEDADTHVVTDFEPATVDQVLYMMDGYRVTMDDGMRFRLLDDDECGAHYVYKGVAYKGGFGYNIWVAQKYIKL